MSNFKWGPRSLTNMYGIHPDLRTVMNHALSVSTVDMSVIEGLRSEERQRKLVAQGKSQTMKSRHLTGHAVDVVPWVNGQITWDWDFYYPMADAIMKAAKSTNIPIRWGGNWHVKDIRSWDGTAEELAKDYPGSFSDGPHFELTWGDYPL